MKKSEIFTFIGILVFWLSCALVSYAGEDNPQRLISLGTSITEELYLLGAQDKLVGCTIYCKRPKDAESKEKIGSIREVNLERLIGLKPDLVLATPLTDPKAIEKMKGLGIKVLILSSPKNFNDICEQFLKIANLVGKDKLAEEIIGNAKIKVNSIKAEVKDFKKPKVFIQVGAKPLFTLTKDSFANDFIEFAGGINIAHDAGIGLYSREEVLRKNPEVIIIVTMGIAGEKEKEIWQKFGTLEAARNNRIYIIDAYKLCSPTPVSFVDTLEEIVRILHQHLLQTH